MRKFSFDLISKRLQIIIGTLALMPWHCWACATCSANDSSNSYFLKMIILMTSVPVLLVAGTIFYIYRAKEKIEEPNGLNER